MRLTQRGFGAIVAIVVLVVLAALAAALTRLGTIALSTTTHRVLGARASLAAAAGIDWGLYQAFKGSWTACSNASETLTFAADAGLQVTVRCTSAVFNDGEASPGVPRIVRIYSIDSVACSGPASCPDDVAAVGAHYVERRRSVQARDAPEAL